MVMMMMLTTRSLFVASMLLVQCWNCCLSRCTDKNTKHQPGYNNSNNNNSTVSTTISTTTDWCKVDSGYYTVTAPNGSSHEVYLSFRRDGTVWLRIGKDSTQDWRYREEVRSKFKIILLTQDVTNFLEQLNYTDQCVLTDLELDVKVNSGVRPFHLDVYLPKSKQNRVILFRHNRSCSMTTTLTLTRDKQALLCDGAPANRNACGRRYLPEVGQATATTFIKSVNFDPIGSDASWQCSSPYQHHDHTGDNSGNNINLSHAFRAKHQQQQVGRYNLPPSVDLHLQRQKIQLQQQHFGSSNQQQQQQLHLNHFRDYFLPRNSITFFGSYYNVYVKVADCDVPMATRAWGHEPKIRSQPQPEKGRVIIPDPLQTAMRHDVISTWHYYAKMTSIQHAIYLQLWRPVVNDNGRRRKSTSLRGGVDPDRDRKLKFEDSAPLNGSLPRQKHRRDHNGDTKSIKSDVTDDTHMFVYRYRLVGQVFDIPKELRFNYIELKAKHCNDNNSQDQVQDGRGKQGRNKSKKTDKNHNKMSSKTAKSNNNPEKQEIFNRSRRWKTRSDTENEDDDDDDGGGGGDDAGNVTQDLGKDAVKHVHPNFSRLQQGSTFLEEATNKTNNFKFLSTVAQLEYQKLKSSSSSSSPPSSSSSSSSSPPSLSTTTAEAPYEDQRHPDYHRHHQRDTPHYHHHHHHHFHQPPNGDRPEIMEVEPGDVLGLFFPFENPIAWSAVPCALNEQRHLYFEAVLDSDSHTARPFQVGQTVDFSRASPGPLACRQYSITAVLSEHPESKFVDDWLCPSWPPPNSASHRHHPSPINPSLHPSSSPSNNANVRKPYSHSIRIDQRARHKYLDVDGVSGLVLMKYAFAVLGSLSLVMIIVGVLSYILATRK